MSVCGLYIEPWLCSNASEIFVSIALENNLKWFLGAELLKKVEL